jgi:hypothetical protein
LNTLIRILRQLPWQVHLVLVFLVFVPFVVQETHRRNVEDYPRWFQELREHEWKAVVSPPHYDQDWGRIFVDVALFKQPTEAKGKPDQRFSVRYHLAPSTPGQEAWKEIVDEASQHGEMKYDWLAENPEPAIPLVDGFQDKQVRYARMIKVQFFRENAITGLRSYFLEPSYNALRPTPVYPGAR